MPQALSDLTRLCIHPKLNIKYISCFTGSLKKFVLGIFLYKLEMPSLLPNWQCSFANIRNRFYEPIHGALNKRHTLNSIFGITARSQVEQ